MAIGSTRHGRTLRICVGASAGGHLSQLLCLSPVWEPYSVFYVTTLPLAAVPERAPGPVYVIGECNRRRPLKAFMVLVRALSVLARERCDVVLTTGSMPLAIMCAVAKLRGTRIVWIDSITNVTRMSLSGRFVRRFADLCLTQWPAVQQRYGDVECVGSIV